MCSSCARRLYDFLRSVLPMLLPIVSPALLSGAVRRYPPSRAGRHPKGGDNFVASDAVLRRLARGHASISEGPPIIFCENGWP